MALINIATLLRQTLKALEKTPVTGGVGLLSYKRNRRVAVLKMSKNRYLFQEQGYTNFKKELDAKELEKILQTAIKREFPRSRKVRLYKFLGPEEMEKPFQKI